MLNLRNLVGFHGILCCYVIYILVKQLLLIVQNCVCTCLRKDVINYQSKFMQYCQEHRCSILLYFKLDSFPLEPVSRAHLHMCISFSYTVHSNYTRVTRLVEEWYSYIVSSAQE